jgi:Bacterial regulatory proteins, lacI family
MTGPAHSPARNLRGTAAVPTSRNSRCRHRDYCRGRARQIAYGRWRPWADAAPVREHLRMLRTSGASYQTIARAAGVSPMTVHRLLETRPASGNGAAERVRAATAERMLAVTSVMVADPAPRRDATGTTRRLQALIAVGHPEAGLARQVGLSPLCASGIVRGGTATVTPATYAAVCGLYRQLWDQRPAERTPAERHAARVARRRAEGHGWAPPMGLDDNRIDDPAYWPRTRWRPAAGTSVTPARARHRRPRRSAGPGASGTTRRLPGDRLDAREPGLVEMRNAQTTASPGGCPQTAASPGTAVDLAAMLAISANAGSAAMTSLAAVTDRLTRADALPVLLDAAYEAFEVLLLVLERHEDPSDSRFVAFVSAATCAANGRDAVLFTPSLPPRQLPRPPRENGPADAPDQGGEPYAALAVSALLEVRLSQAAEQPADPADRLGCRTAAGYARRIHVLLTGSGP